MKSTPVVTFGKRALQARKWTVEYLREEQEKYTPDSPEYAAYARSIVAEQEKCAALEKSITAREADARFHVVIKPIPGLAVLEARTDAAESAARRRARLALTSEGAGVGPGEIAEAVRLDATFQAEDVALRDEWLNAGLENASEEIKRLFMLGRDDLLKQVAMEIRAWQHLDPALGEG